MLTGAPMNLHVNIYTAAVDTQGNADCESGQRGYMQRAATYHAGRTARSSSTRTSRATRARRSPGRARVPPGQTFTRTPQSGPRMPAELDP